MNPFDVGFFTEHELKNLGFKRLGNNISIAKNCTIIGLQNISIGDNVRIDGYSTIVASGDGFFKYRFHLFILADIHCYQQVLE